MNCIIPGQSVLTVGANKETFCRLSRERIRGSFGREEKSGEVFNKEVELKAFIENILYFKAVFLGHLGGDSMMWIGLTLEGEIIEPAKHHMTVYFSAGRAQPDNREGNEVCLAVLNNFYGDGVKFHDVACHHRKPVICEDA